MTTKKNKRILVNKINGTYYLIEKEHLIKFNIDESNAWTDYKTHTIFINTNLCLSEEIYLLKKELAKAVMYEYGLIDLNNEVFDVDEVALILARYGELVDDLVKKYYFTE